MLAIVWSPTEHLSCRLQYTTHFKNVKPLNKRTKKHLEASIVPSHPALMSRDGNLRTNSSNRKSASSSSISDKEGSRSFSEGNMHVAAVALSQIFYALVESGERPSFQQKDSEPLARSVDDPSRIKVIRAAFGALSLLSSSFCLI